MVAAALAAGCSPPTVGEYAEELELAYCEWETECHRFPGVTECQGARGLDQDPDFAYLIAAVKAGTAEYDGEAARDCLAAIRERGCEEAEPEPPAVCDDVFRGRIGRNGPCMSSLECAGDAVCGFDPSCADECCPGACRVLPDPLAEGEACGGTAPCEEGLYCAVDPMTFVSTVCTPRVKAGGSCLLGEACVADAYCEDTTATCRELVDRAEGESCGRREERCVAPAECHYVQPPGDEFGEAEQTCVVPGHLGAPCDPQDYSTCARFDTYCDEGSRLCTLLPVPGSACASSGCAEYAYCETGPYVEGQAAGPGTCKALAGAGERCGEVDGAYVQCLGDLWCDEDSRCSLQTTTPVECPVPGAE